MIIVRYLCLEIFKSQFFILFILLMIFFCQKLVRVLDAVMDGELPINLVFDLLWLGVFKMAEFVIPLSLFLSILIAFSRKYVENEIIVMYACGLSQKFLIKVILIVALSSSVIAILNVFWFAPLSSRYEEKIIQSAKSNPTAMALIAGHFQVSGDGNSVVYIENIKGNKLFNIFVAYLSSKGNMHPSVFFSKYGYFKVQNSGSQVLFLGEGHHVEGTAFSGDFRVTDFERCRIVINHKNIDFTSNLAEQSDFLNLFYSKNPAFRTELHWRLTLIFSVFLMALIVVPLSILNPRQGSSVSLLPAVLLYFIFFLFQSLLKSNGEKALLNSAFWMWFVNFFYFSLAVFLNIWDTVLIHRLRFYFRSKWRF